MSITPFTFRPAKRENTPLIIGIAGPTKSGKTFSALRLAMGLANGGPVAMLNTEGKRGEQYADNFTYLNCNMDAPFGCDRYEQAILAMKDLKPAACIIDSGTHMHDGPGGLLEQHDAELTRMAGTDYKKREKCNFTAWIKPKRQENQFVYTMLTLECPMVICFRAKEKLSIVAGRDPVNLGWQPIVSERVAFETIFTLVLPPHSRGVPDLELSEMRDPFDKMIPPGKPIDEDLGRRLTEWARGGAQPVARREDVPAGSEPVCMECSKAAGDEVPMMFVPAGLKSNREPYPAFWKCPKGIKGHEAVKHADVLQKIQEAESTPA